MTTSCVATTTPLSAAICNFQFNNAPIIADEIRTATTNPKPHTVKGGDCRIIVVTCRQVDGILAGNPENWPLLQRFAITTITQAVAEYGPDFRLVDLWTRFFPALYGDGWSTYLNIHLARRHQVALVAV